MKRYILTVCDDFDPDKVDMSKLKIISLTTCRDCGMEPPLTLGNLARLFGNKSTEFACWLRGKVVFKCNRDSEVIRRHYSSYIVTNILPITDSIISIGLEYPSGEEGKE